MLGQLHFSGEIRGATINILTGPQGRKEPSLAKALALLASMPLETVPEPGLLPAGSVLSWSSNPRSVGRREDLRALARALQAGEDAASRRRSQPTGAVWAKRDSLPNSRFATAGISPGAFTGSTQAVLKHCGSTSRHARWARGPRAVFG